MFDTSCIPTPVTGPSPALHLKDNNANLTRLLATLVASGRRTKTAGGLARRVRAEAESSISEIRSPNSGGGSVPGRAVATRCFATPERKGRFPLAGTPAFILFGWYSTPYPLGQGRWGHSKRTDFEKFSQKSSKDIFWTVMGTFWLSLPDGPEVGYRQQSQGGGVQLEGSWKKAAAWPSL